MSEKTDKFGYPASFRFVSEPKKSGEKRDRLKDATAKMPKELQERVEAMLANLP